MWRRMTLALSLAGTALIASVVPALAGGWAISSLDSLPVEGFRAGETHQVGYTILQHGQTPFREARTSIEIQSVATGEVLRFAAVPEGPVGHYVATVHFPTAGEYAWKVDQYPFEPHSLGKVVVAAPAAASVQSASSANHTSSLFPFLRLALPAAALLTLALFISRLLVVIGRPRHLQTSAPRAVGGQE